MREIDPTHVDTGNETAPMAGVVNQFRLGKGIPYRCVYIDKKSTRDVQTRMYWRDGCGSDTRGLFHGK